VTDATTVEVVRTIAAPVAKVFAAWTDAATLRLWLAPSPSVVLEASADARPGGRYRIVVVDGEGDRHVTSGEYREVVREKRLVKTWVYEGKHSAGPYRTLLTVEFRETGPRSTELTLRQDPLVTAEDRARNTDGWRLCLDNLEALLR
jgi:glutathione S-transferase